jgi:hypothetical protein
VAEQLFRKQQVLGSNPRVGSSLSLVIQPGLTWFAEIGAAGYSASSSGLQFYSDARTRSVTSRSDYAFDPLGDAEGWAAVAGVDGLGISETDVIHEMARAWRR